MTREQIEAWLILEGYRPYTQDRYWIVADDRYEYTRSHADERNWSGQTYTAGCDDRPISWAEIPDQLLVDLYKFMTGGQA